MSGSLPPSAIERIDAVCDQFEAAWQAGQQPRVEDYLHAEAGPERDVLLEELLRLQAHYRRRVQGPSSGSGGTALPDGPFVEGYEVLGELGRGGMGVVYKARQLRPNRLVALKMISAGPHAGSRELDRFVREADAVAQLQHPHIVQVYEVGEQDGHPYFAFEYVDGGSLDQYLSGTPQPPHAAALLVERLAHAIHHAHQRGIIHRDLKPGNVLLQPIEAPRNDGTRDPRFSILDPRASTAKITDFGLAKVLDAGAGNPTQTGELLGSPNYMAPEQVRGGGVQITAETDVYGLGAILYELLTGRPPFRGETALETMLQVETVEPVSPSRLQPRCPRELVTICLKCLRKHSRQRYATALELAEDLRRFLDGQPIRARPVGPLEQAIKWTRRQPVVAGLAALLLLAVTSGIATGSWLWWQAADGLQKAEVALGKERAAQAARVATVDRYQVALAHREWLANNVGRAEALLDACTEEQRRAWEWRYLDRMRRSALHTFTGHTNTVQALAVHPSGLQIASASHDTTVRLWDLERGNGSILGQHRSLVLAVTYSADGRLLASSDYDGGVKLWDAQRAVPLRDLARGGTGSVWGLAFDPSSRYLAVGGRGHVKVWDTRDETWVYDQRAHESQIFQVAFSPDGRLLATSSAQVRVWDWASDADAPLHQWPGHRTRTRDLAFSPDGNWLASCGRDGQVRVYSLLRGEEEFALSGHQLAVTSVAFSPDSERLASAGQDGDMHIWSVNERRRLFTLHGHSGAVWDLAYTPDGSRLVSAGSDDVVRVWHGTASQEAVVLPIRTPYEIRALAYGPGGRLLAWGDASGRVGLWDTVLGDEVIRLDGTDSRGRNPILSFAFSPSGRQVAWREFDGSATLWDLEQGAEVALPGAPEGKILGLAFSADGAKLWAAHSEKGVLRLRDLLSGQELLRLARPGAHITQVAWSPDTRYFVTVEDRKQVRLWDAQNGRLRCELEHKPSLTYVTFSADGRRLAVGGVGGRMRVWDLTTNRETMAVTGHSSNLYGLVLSPDGRRLASTASDCTAKLWDTQTGHEVLTLRTQLHEHSALAFSPDGADLASVTMDGHLQIWSTRNVRRSP